MKCQLISYISHVGANSDLTNIKNERNQDSSEQGNELLVSVGLLDKAVIILDMPKSFQVSEHSPQDTI